MTRCQLQYKFVNLQKHAEVVENRSNVKLSTHIWLQNYAQPNVGQSFDSSLDMVFG